jgi:hypothetical protein
VKKRTTLCEKNKNNYLKYKQQQKDALKSQHGLPDDEVLLNGKQISGRRHHQTAWLANKFYFAFILSSNFRQVQT